jgi:hypothetical protein
MTGYPPPAAERLLRWSLLPEDRDAVLGDLHEEFITLGAAAGPRAATRWYWMQAVLSVGPNLVRRIQGESQRHRREETADDRASRLSRRKWALILIAIGAPSLVFGDSYDIIELVVLFVGVSLLLSSLAPTRKLDPINAARQRRRANLFWLFLFMSTWRPDFLGQRFPTHDFSWAAFVAATAIGFWPLKYWIFGQAAIAPVMPQVRSPFIGYGRAADGTLFLPVDAPAKPAALGDLIVGRPNQPRIEINRVFSTADAVRVFGVIGQGANPLRVAIDVLDGSGRAVATVQAPLSPADEIQHAESWRRATIPVAQIDQTIPLHDFAPGNYRLRVVATDGAHRSEKHADFRISAA